MSDTVIRLTRQQLYEKVWSTAMYRVAAELGLSGRGLAKVCDRNGIPFPGRGYWAQKAVGKVGPQPPLKPLPKGESDTLAFQPDPRPSPGEPTPEPLVVPVAEQLSTPHPLVEATRKALRKAKKQEDGRLRVGSAGALDVNIGRQTMDRVLRLLDALVKALETRGMTVQADGGDQPKTSVSIPPETVTFRLHEAVDRSIQPLSKAQERDKLRNPWRYSTPTWDFKPNGQLGITLEAGWFTGLKKSWSDGKRDKLEKLLPRIVLTIEQIIADEKVRREKAAEDAQRRIEQERIREEQAVLEFQSARRAAVITDRVKQSQLAQEIRAWIDQQRQNQLDELTVTWLDWADGYAGRLEATCGRFPAFEVEPTYDDRRKYRMDSYW